MQSNRIVVILSNEYAITYGKNINTVYLNSHLHNEFVVRPDFLLGATEAMWVTFNKGDIALKPLMLAPRKTSKLNATAQVIDDGKSTITQLPDSGYEYYIALPDAVQKNVGEWTFSLTVSELPAKVKYVGTVETVAALPASGTYGDTYWVTGTSSYYYWNGQAWSELSISATATSDVGKFTVNASVSGDIGGTATDLDIQVLYSFVVDVIDNLSDYLPKIGENGNWYVWSSEDNAYVDSGEPSKGAEFFSTTLALNYNPDKIETTDFLRAMFSPTTKVARVGDFIISRYTDDTSTTPATQTLRSSIGQISEINDTVYKVRWTGFVTGEQGADGAKGDQGEQGEAGLAALTYSGVIGASSAPVIDVEIASFTGASFNRVPIVGDVFAATWDDYRTSAGVYYLTTFKVTAVTEQSGVATSVKAKVIGFVKTSGEEGVGIEQIKESSVEGGTKVEIVLTNGTSSSFIVKDGDVSNITAFEFPYGTPTVTYDTTDGLHIHANLRVTINGTNADIPLDLEIPQIAGDGLSEDVNEEGTHAIVKLDNTVVRTNATSAQTINSAVIIGGDLTVKGTTTTVKAETVNVKKKLIVVAEGNTVALTSPAGLMAPKYDGTNSGALVFDSTGTAYVGDVVLDSDGDIDVSKSDLQPLVTRGTLVDGNVVKWNAEKLRLEDTGIKATEIATKSEVAASSNFIYTLNYESATVPTVGQVLTLTNANFTRKPVVGDKFSLVEVVNTKDTYDNNMEVLTVGDTTCTAKITSFTDVTSGKLDKVTGTSINPLAYVKNADGTQGTKIIDDGVTGGAVVMRTASGQIKAADGVDDNDLATKGQMDTAIETAVDGKLDKVTETTSDDMVYVKKADGTQTQYACTQWIHNGGIVRYSDSGNVKVQPGTTDYDAVNKKQMDTADTTTLNSAKTYTDTAIATAITTALNTEV